MLEYNFFKIFKICHQNKIMLRVAVRVRPSVDKSSNCVQVFQDNHQIQIENTIGIAKSFGYDQVFGEEATQQDIYSNCCSAIV